MNQNLLLKISLFANAGLLLSMLFFAGHSGVTAHALDGDNHRGMGRGMHRMGFAQFCNEQPDERIDRLVAYAEERLELTSTQVDRLNQLTTTMKTSASETLTPVCANLSQDQSLTAPERLARLQTFAESGSQVISQIRPAFNAFYTSLSEEQQQELDTLMARRQHHRPLDADWDANE